MQNAMRAHVKEIVQMLELASSIHDHPISNVALTFMSCDTYNSDEGEEEYEGKG